MMIELQHLVINAWKSIVELAEAKQKHGRG
jgi:hypothetical protein